MGNSWKFMEIYVEKEKISEIIRIFAAKLIEFIN